MLAHLVLAALCGPLPSDVVPPRPRAAQALESALQQAERARRAGRSAWPALEGGIAAARQALGADSEVGRDLGALARGARFQGFLADDDGAAWLAEQLPAVVDDLRFRPLREADLPEGFPDPTPVGEIQLQRYPAYRAARTPMEERRSGGAFWRLFGHIQRNDIAMTAPVETTLAAEDAGAPGPSMAFLYASPELGRPGHEGPVEVVDVPAQVVVSLGLRGQETRERIAEARRRLERWLLAHPEWVAIGPPRTMGHNSPMVRGERRYFEVQIPVKNAGTTVIDFTDPGEAPRWSAVDDVVMGGRSSSRMARTPEGTSVFTGDLSLENDGGFASVRTDGERCSLAGATRVTLRVRGDGRSYRLRCRTSAGFDVPSYQATFPTRAGEWADVTLELADFEPTWRGRPVPGAPPLDPGAVRGLGLMVADGQAGPFRLELRSLAKR